LKLTQKPTRKKLQERIDELEIEIVHCRTREEAIYNASKNISSDLSLEKALNNIVLQITDTLNLSGCSISIWNREHDQLETMVDYSRVHPEKLDEVGAVYPLKNFPKTRFVLEEGRTAIIQHDDSSEEKSELALMSTFKILTLVMSPLIAKNKVIGLLELYEEEKSRIYSNDEINLIESLASHAAIAIRNSHLYEKAQQEISERKNAEEELRELVDKLEKTLDEVKTLSGLLPICAQCKKIRDDKGYWNNVESFIEKRLDTSFSHGLCPDCTDQLYGGEQWYIQMKKEKGID